MKKMIAILLTLLLLTLPAMAEPAVILDTSLANQPTQLTVTGSATVALPADAAMITLGVRETAADVQEAQNTVNAKIAAIRAELIDLGIENADIATESLYIYANYNYDDGDGTEIVSYTATNTLSITVRNVDNAGAAIDTAFAAGANTLENVGFYATDNSAASDQAYAEAVADAMHKAEIIAEAAGMKCASIQSISEGHVDTWYDNGMKLRASGLAAADEAVATDVQASSVMVSANVTVTYALYTP